MTTIVGAGAAGLSLALMLDGDVSIVEREPEPGGLCRSSFVDGFTFDVGPHILGGIPDAVAWVVESTGLRFVEGRTRNTGWHAGEWLTHPFIDEALGYDYMAKMWKVAPESLLLPALGAQPGRRPGGVSTFLYPERGGYQAITDAWARRLDDRITYGVEAVDPEGTVWTAPVEGRYNALVTVTAGFLGEAPRFTAIYLPGDWTPFHRLSFPSAFAPSNAPHGTYSIQAEASIPDGSSVSSDDVYEDAMRDTLDRLGLLSPRWPLFMDVQHHAHAYPVPIGEPGAGHGRTGGRKYLNVDGVVAASMQLATQLQ